jgi:hypothetical protein
MRDIVVFMDAQTITTQIPKDLLAKAQAISGKGIHETLCEGLELLLRQQAYQKLKQLRGTMNITADLDALRRDE